MNVSLKIDLNNLNEKQYSDFQRGFDDLVDSLGINANVNMLDEVLISNLNKKIDNKYLLEDINYHIENNELESYLGLTKDEWKNASIDDNNINNLLSYIADKRDEWRQESMNIDEVLDEFESSYKDTIEVNDIKKLLKDGKKVACDERLFNKETNIGKEI